MALRVTATNEVLELPSLQVAFLVLGFLLGTAVMIFASEVVPWSGRKQKNVAAPVDFVTIIAQPL